MGRIAILMMISSCAGVSSERAAGGEPDVEAEAEVEAEGEAEAEAEPEAEPEADADADVEAEAEAEPQAASDSPEARELRVYSPSHDTPARAPHAVVFGTRRAERIVIFLHGWGGCARALAFDGEVECFVGGPRRTGWNLTGIHASRVDELLVVAQLSWLRRSGDAGRFAEDGYAARWLDALQLPALPITLVAHSAGFETALAMLQHGQLGDRVDRLVLFDALYAGTEPFVEWAAADPNRRILSYYTGSSSTRRQNRRLRGLAANHNLSVGEAIGPDPIVSLHTTTRHGDVPLVHWAEALDAMHP